MVEAINEADRRGFPFAVQQWGENDFVVAHGAGDGVGPTVYATITPGPLVSRWGVRMVAVYKWGQVRRADAGDVLRLLGLRAGGHLPVEGMAERVIGGVRVFVAPVVASVCTCEGRDTWARHSRACRMRRGSRPHRVIAICECGQHVAVGRLHQHKCKPSRIVSVGWLFGGWAALWSDNVFRECSRRVVAAVHLADIKGGR